MYIIIIIHNLLEQRVNVGDKSYVYTYTVGGNFP